MQIEIKENEIIITDIMLDENGTSNEDDTEMIKAFESLGAGKFTIILRKEVV